MRTDPFTFYSNAIDRLYSEWKKHPKLIVACDFDDTLYDFHQKGDTHNKVIDLLKRCKEHDFYVVMFTASKPERFDMIREYMDSKGIQIDGFNENPIPLPFGNHGKIYFNILLDDRAGLGEAVTILDTVLNLIDFSKKYPNLTRISTVESMIIYDKFNKTAAIPLTDSEDAV